MTVQMIGPRLYLVIGIFALVMLYVQLNPAMSQVSSIANNIVINEVETNPLGDDSKSIVQWVELYNPTSQPVNIGSWTIGATTGLRNTYTIPVGTNIQSKQFITYTYGPSWFPHIGAVVQLKDKNGLIVDQTPPLDDQQSGFNTWQRIADGFNTNSTSDWVFKPGTPGSSNGKLSANGPSSALSVTVGTDKTNYVFGNVVKISGQVSKQVNVPNLSYIPEQVKIAITGPGFSKTVTMFPDLHNQYETDLKTDQILGFQEGIYKIAVTYSDASSDTQFILSAQPYVPPPQQAQTNLTLSTDKPSYLLGDPINLVGSVSKIIPLTPVTYKVYDPNNVQVYDGNLFPDTQGRITSYNQYRTGATSYGVVINPVNPVYGTYSIVAKYDDTATTTTFNLIPVPSLSAPIVATTDKLAYGLGDTVTVSGRTNLVGVNDFQIEIIQSYTSGVVRSTYDIKSSLDISPDGSFSYQLQIPATTDRFGSYRAIVSEKAYKAEADFNVVENPSTFVATNSGPLSITTDQSSYAIGDQVSISGNIASSQVTTATSLIISVLNGNGTALISKANTAPNLSGGIGTGVVDAPLKFYAYPDSNGNYKITETLYRSVFQPGTYILKATYNKLTSTTSFSVYDPLVTGNQAIVANTDKQVYGIGDTVHLTGKISSSVDTSSYTIILTQPNGNIISGPLTINNGFFSWDWTIPNSPITSGNLATIINSGRQNVVTINNYPNTFGIYRITIGSNHGSTDLFFGVSKNPQSETKLSPFFFETDKTNYTTTQTVQVFGQVIPKVNTAALEQNSMVNLVVYTSTGQVAFRATAQVSAGGQFQTSIDLRPGVFQTGTYKIYGDYLGAVSTTTFHVTDTFTTSSNKLSLLLTTDGNKYLPGQKVLITGRTSFIVSINSVDISVGLANDTTISEGQVVSKSGSVLPRIKIPFDQTSSFSYDYSIPNNAKLGNYTIMAKVPFGVFSTSFQVVNQLPSIVPPVNATQGNATQGTPQGNATHTTSIVPSTIGPTQKQILSNAIVDKVNRITDSLIPITFKEKTIGNSTFYPRMIDGLLLVNLGNELSVNLKVTMQDGTCLIGQDSNCKITGSTQSSGSLYQTVQIGNQNFLVGYTGADARIEKFTILPADANGIIPDGQWNVQIIKKDEPSRFYYQITYVSK
jgi:hypothetical protein